MTTKTCEEQNSEGTLESFRKQAIRWHEGIVENYIFNSISLNWSGTAKWYMVAQRLTVLEEMRYWMWAGHKIWESQKFALLNQRFKSRPLCRLTALVQSQFYAPLMPSKSCILMWGACMYLLPDWLEQISTTFARCRWCNSGLSVNAHKARGWEDKIIFTMMLLHCNVWRFKCLLRNEC